MPDTATAGNAGTTNPRVSSGRRFRMIHTLRSQPELADMAIVVVTGLSPDEIESGGGIPDGIPVLPKPIPFEQLHEIARGIAADRDVAKAPKNTIERKSN